MVHHRLLALVAAVLSMAPRSGIDLAVTTADMESILAVARRGVAARAAFHRPYLVETNRLPVERVEVITERRRLMLLAESHLAGGERSFVHGTLRATDALRPWRRRLAVVAHLRFHPLNSYVLAPSVEIRLLTRMGTTVTSVTQESQTLFGFGPGRPGEPLPIWGARGEALFDAATIEQEMHWAVVLLDQVEVSRVAIDLRLMP